MNFGRSKALVFVVKSSRTDRRYHVTIPRNGDNFIARCTCIAAVNRMACKHRLRLFEGDITDLEGGVVDKVSQLAEMLTGTEVKMSQEAILGLATRCDTHDNVM